MIVCALRIELHLPLVHSLKEKRAAIRPIIDGARNRYHVAAAETGFQDLWQRVEIGVAVVGAAPGHVGEIAGRRRALRVVVPGGRGDLDRTGLGGPRRRVIAASATLRSAPMAAEHVRIISPVDGRVYAQRPVASDEEVEAAVAMARAAQRAWARTPVAERAAVCRAAVDAMNEMAADIVTELAWQMGRRSGTERGAAGLHRAQPLHDRRRTGRPGPRRGRREGRVRALRRAGAPGPRAGGGAVEQPVPHGRQLDRPRAHGGQRPCCSSTPRRRCSSASGSRPRSTAPVSQRGCSATSSCRTRRRPSCWPPASSTR